MEFAEQTPLVAPPPPYPQPTQMGYCVPVVPVYVPVYVDQTAPPSYPFFGSTSSVSPYQMSTSDYANFIQFMAPHPEYIYSSDQIEMEQMHSNATVQPPPTAPQDSAVKRCVRCEKSYHEADNNDKACRFHTGKYLTKYHSQMGVGTYRAWTCCKDVSRAAIGCRITRHMEDKAFSQMMDQINFMVKTTEGMRLSQPPKYREPNIHEKLMDPELQQSINQATLLDPELSKMKEDDEDIEFPELEETRTKVDGKEYLKHTVRSTDTLFGLSIKYRVGVDEIKLANQLANNDSLFTRHHILIPDKGQKLEKMSSEEKNKAKQQLKLQLITRFARTAQCPVSEAKYYLELSRYNIEKALAERKTDVQFEKTHVAPIPISHNVSKQNQKV